MSESPTPEPGPPPEERMVTEIRVWCKKCRRARGAALSGKGVQPGRVQCPHGVTLYAPGHGVGEGPPDPTTPEERRQGPV